MTSDDWQMAHLHQAFLVHHNPDRGGYAYDADPTDAIASATALAAEGTGRWVAGNCQRMIRAGDLLLFKFGGARLKQASGVYAAGRALEVPCRDGKRWVFRYRMDRALTDRLVAQPLVGATLARVVSRSHGASIQRISPAGMRVLGKLLALPRDDGITRGLLILKGPLDKILAGTKTWEVRGNATKVRGRVALIESKSGHVVGVADIVDVVGPLSLAQLHRASKRTGFRPTRIPYATTYGWVIANARRLTTPIPYRHPSGAVIWVLLKGETFRRVNAS
jgi:hypothetical protein